MVDPRRHAAALLAALSLAAPAPALAQDRTLLAQIDDATATMAQSQPPLSEDPFEEPGGGEDRRDEEPAVREPKPLPETGIEAGLVALLGLGLIASGSGLRLTLGRNVP